MKMHFAIALFLVGPNSFANSQAEICVAPSITEFHRRQAQLSGDIYGPEASFDYTNMPACTLNQQRCLRQTIADGGVPGYYDAHNVYYITLGEKVIFASTSEYSDGTYGSNHGLPNAEAIWNETYQRLIEITGCK